MRSPTVSPILQQIAQQARAYPDFVFTTLAHHIDVDLLHEAYDRTAKQAAPGIDGITAGTYAENLEENLTNLHQRLRSGSYQAPPVKRVWLEKDDGSQRPIGMPTFEDKIAQRAVAMILEMDVLPKRFSRFGLTIHPTKTQLIAFRRPAYKQKSGKGHDTFDFLGLTHFWARSSKGSWVIKRKTAKKRMQRAMNALANWCRQNRHLSLKEQHRMLCQKLMGHYQYYGIIGNFQMLDRVHRHAVKIWRFWLDRRSSKNAMPWDKYLKILNTFPLLRPRIVQPI